MVKFGGVPGGLCAPSFFTCFALASLFSASLLLFLLMARPGSLTLPASPAIDRSGQERWYSQRRLELYERLATDLEKKGPSFLTGGTTSQSLMLSDIFTVKGGKIYPTLKPADPAVRAVILYLKPQYSLLIWQTVKRILEPYFPEAIWYQDPNLYHFSMYHASHHLEPVAATPDKVDAETRTVEAVAKHCCPLSIVLDRVVLTSTGVLLGCWQVVSGTDPVIIRDELGKALPKSPAKQLYDSVILHTSLARLLGAPNSSSKGLTGNLSSSVALFKDLVSQLNNELQNLKKQATVDELWFVEELDVLALALNGRIKERRYRLLCDRQQ
eukprot:c25843_g1_i1 orf=420-1400(-)